MSDYAIVYVVAKDIDQTQYKDILPQAKEALAAAKPDEILMLQIKVNTPKVLTKALTLSEENLVKIAQID